MTTVTEAHQLASQLRALHQDIGAGRMANTDALINAANALNDLASELRGVSADLMDLINERDQLANQLAELS